MKVILVKKLCLNHISNIALLDEKFIKSLNYDCEEVFYINFLGKRCFKRIYPSQQQLINHIKNNKMKGYIVKLGKSKHDSGYRYIKNNKKLFKIFKVK